MKRFQSERNESAFNEIYSRYSQRILYFMYRVLNGNEELAQDLLHDIFERIIKRPELFDTNKNFKTWIFTVASNECKGLFRKEKKEADIEMVSLQEFSFSPENLHDKIQEKQFRRALGIALSELSYVHRTTFILRYQEQSSIKEISAVMECSEGTVKSRTFNCLKILAVKLADFNPQNV